MLCFLGLSNVVLRHDLAEKPPTMSEANPHLIFHGFTAKTGLRLKTILQAWLQRALKRLQTLKRKEKERKNI